VIIVLTVIKKLRGCFKEWCAKSMIKLPGCEAAWIPFGWNPGHQPGTGNPRPRKSRCVWFLSEQGCLGNGQTELPRPDEINAQGDSYLRSTRPGVIASPPVCLLAFCSRWRRYATLWKQVKLIIPFDLF
jgi:hypothetical protein